MAQGNNGSQGILERVMARFAAKKGGGAPQGGNQPQEEPQYVVDPKDPLRNVPNPKWKDPKTSQRQTQSTGNTTDLYSGLFDEPTQDPNKKSAPRFNLSQDAISKAASKLDFLSDLPDELRTKLDSGEPIDTQTMVAMMNHAGRGAYSRAMEHGSSLTDMFVGSRIGHEMQGLPSQIRTHLAKSKATGRDNIRDNPAVQEHLGLVAERLAAKFPDASEDEIAAMADEYFMGMAKAINPDAFGGGNDGQGRNQDDGAHEIDFSAYLSGEKSLSDAKQPAQGQGNQNPGQGTQQRAA